MSGVLKRIISYYAYELPSELPAIVRTGSERNTPDTEGSRLHFHNCTEIGFCRFGEGTLTFDNGLELIFREGDVSVIPHYVPHKITVNGENQISCMFLYIDLVGILRDVSLFQEIFDRVPDWMPYHYIYSKELSGRINFLANCMLEEIIQKKKLKAQILKSLSLVMCAELLRIRSVSGIKNRGNNKFLELSPALKFIHFNYAQTISVKELAEICCLNVNRFRRMFVSAMGIPPQSYINSLRIYYSRLLLTATNMSVLEVAESVGLGAVDSFNRIFKRTTGVTPSEYRKKESIEPPGSEDIQM